MRSTPGFRLFSSLLPALLLSGCWIASRPTPTPSPGPTPAGRPIADMAIRHPAPPGHGNVDAAETRAAREPDSADAQQALGLAYYAAGAYEPAANLLKKATSLSPDRPLAWLYLGYAQMGTGQIDDAIAALKKATSLQGLPATQRSEAYLERGNLLYQVQQDDQGAAEAFRRSLRENPRQGAASLALGTWHAARGQRAEAKTHFLRAVQNLPAGRPRAEAHTCLGRLAEEAKDPAAAIRHYRAALAQHKGNAWATRALARLNR